jgi:hydrogenase maturation factor
VTARSGSSSPELGADLAADLAVTALAVARRIATGATLWCVCPTAPAHAGHLAVEFLHPVVMGKRAVPAVAVDGRDALATLRSARPGDILVMLGPSDDRELGTLSRRTAPWGLESAWLVTDDGPGCQADHVLRVTVESDPTVDLVLAYHLLWELTHVVFEHPGLLRSDGPEPVARCITCADEAQLAEVQSVDGGHATVRMRGTTAELPIDLVDDVRHGDLLLVHAGVAIDRIDEPA